MACSRSTTSVESALSSTDSRSCSLSGSSLSTRDLDRSGEITWNDGFSVVAPISTMSPDSTAFRMESCCALLKRWISSRKSSVFTPLARFASPAWITFLTSATPDETALRKWASMPNRPAMILARVVLPVPGAPQRIMEKGVFFRNIECSTFPSPSSCRCPAYSSSIFGLHLSASGGKASGLSFIGSSPGPIMASDGGPCGMVS